MAQAKKAAKSKPKARKYLLAAAKQGIREARELLGNMLGSEISPGDSTNAAAEVLLLLDLACSQGSQVVFAPLGWFHLNGSGGREHSLERAIYWYTKGAKSQYDYEGRENEFYELAQLLLAIS